MKYYSVFICSCISLVQAREHWWFSTHGYNKVAINSGASTPAHEQPNQEAQQAQSILASVNDTEFNNETSSTTTPHAPIIVNSKREAPINPPSETTTLSEIGTKSSVIIVASKRDGSDLDSLQESIPEVSTTTDEHSIVKRESASDNDTSTVLTVSSQPIIVASKRDVPAQNEEVVEDNIVEGNSTDGEAVESTTAMVEEEAASETEDVDRRKREAEESQTETEGQNENVIEDLASDVNAEYEKHNHPFARVRRVSKAGSSHKIRNDKNDQNSPYVQRTTQAPSDEDDSDE